MDNNCLLIRSTPDNYRQFLYVEELSCKNRNALFKEYRNINGAFIWEDSVMGGAFWLDVSRKFLRGD